MAGLKVRMNFDFIDFQKVVSMPRAARSAETGKAAAYRDPTAWLGM
jgi:hypothetical protein